MTVRTPSMSDWFRAAFDSRLEDMQTSGPGVVVAYDPVKQLCSAQPAIHASHEGEDGQRVSEASPVITGIPVAFPRGGGYGVTFPLAAGDEVLLVFSRRCIDRWKTQGGVIDPGDDRCFHISDAMAIPGLGSAARALANAGADHMVIGHDTGVRIHLTATEVSVGGEAGAAHLVARADRTEARLQALEQGHKHYAPSTGGVTSTPILTTPEYDAQIGPTTTLVPNPAHGLAGHVHYNTAPDPEPTVNSTGAGAGAGVAVATLRAV